MIDPLGSPPVPLHQLTSPSPTAERILLVQLADIGDLVLATPAIAALREAKPHAHLTLLTSAHAAQVLDRDLVDEIITVEKRSLNQTLALIHPQTIRTVRNLDAHDSMIIFHHFTTRLGTLKFYWVARSARVERIYGLQNGNGWFLTHEIDDDGFGARHQAEYWLALVGLLGADTSARRAQVGFDDGILPIAAHRGTRIVIHPGSGGFSLARRWYPERFAAVADALHEAYDAQIVIVGTPEDGGNEVAQAMQAPAINLSAQTTLTQLTDVIRSAHLFIGADSGVMHIAAAVRIPVLAIFGPSNHRAWSPWSPGSNVSVLRSAPSCSPCSYVEHRVGARDGCAAKTCMHLVSTEQVLQAARDLLDGRRVLPPTERPRPRRDWNDRIYLLDLPVDRITFTEWMRLIDQWVKTGTRLHHVCTINPEFMMLAQKDLVFRAVLERADLCVPDGVGLLWAAKHQRTPLPERVTGSDGLYWIAEHAAQWGWKLYFLGAAPGVAEKAAENLVDRYPGLKVVGTYAGSPAADEEDYIVQRVNASRADILLVAYGAPRQDQWIARNELRLNVKMAMGIGGSLDFAAGVVPRAPVWMQERGIEWLFRLLRDPRRFGRMLRLPRFVFAILRRGRA